MTDISFLQKQFTDIIPYYLKFGKDTSFDNHLTFAHCHTISYVFDGSGEIIVNGIPHQILQGKAFITKPGCTVRFISNKDNPWNIITIGFSGALSINLNAFSEISLNLQPTVFTQMKDVTTLETTREEYLISKLFLIYAELFEKRKSKDYVARVITYIESNYQNKLQIEDISALLTLDRHYLSRVFKKEIGMSMQEFIKIRRLNQSKFYLEKGYSIAEIAALVGYYDVSSFSRAFCKHFGYSPGKMLKNE